MKIPLFDNDGTLLVAGTNVVHDNAFNEALHTVYQLPSTTDVHEITTGGKIDSQILIEVAMLHGVPEDQAIALLPKAFAVMIEYFEAHKQEGTPKAERGALELLKLLKGNIHVGVLTGNVEQLAWEKLAQAGLKDYIEFGAFGNMALKRVELIKVAQERYEKLFNEHRPLNDFVIIGDTPKDIACAREGGIQVIAVATGHNTQEALKDADLVVESLKEQEKILKFLS